MVVYFAELYWDLVNTYNVHLPLLKYKQGLGRAGVNQGPGFATLAQWSKRMLQLRSVQECDAWEWTEHWVRRGERT